MPGGLVSGDHQRPQTTPTMPTTKKVQNEDFRRWSGWLLSLTYSAGTEQGWLCLHWNLELQQQWRWTHWATGALRQCNEFHSPVDCKTVLTVISKVLPPTALVCLQTFWIAWPDCEDACQVHEVREWKWEKSQMKRKWHLHYCLLCHLHSNNKGWLQHGKQRQCFTASEENSKRKAPLKVHDGNDLDLTQTVL